MNYDDIPSLREYVRVKKDKNLPELEKARLYWLKASAANRLSYEIDWLGIPIIQTPEDMILMQELIFKVKPEVIIETGIAHMGSLVYYASLMELFNKGTVIGVDIEIRKHNLKAVQMHPMFKRITLVKGDSVAQGTLKKIKKLIPPQAKVIVCLDSEHKKSHVLKELELYKEFVSPGGYIVVFDTYSSELAKLGVFGKEWVNNGPQEAIGEFLKGNDEFEIDKSYNKLFISYSPNGYLKRIK